MTWVLILAVYIGSSGVSMATHEFSSKERCEEAGKAMTTEMKRGRLNLVDLGRFVCVQK